METPKRMPLGKEKGADFGRKRRRKNYGIFSVVPYVPSDELK